MPDYPIELGRTYSGMDFTSAGPTESPPEKHYPDVRFEWSEKYDLPASGTVTFKYRTTKEETKTFPDGKQKFCLDIDLLEIVGTKASKVSDRSYDDAAEGLDRIKAELEAE